MRGLMRRKSEQRELPFEAPSRAPSAPAARGPEPSAPPVSTPPLPEPSVTARLLEELAAACAAAPLEEKILVAPTLLHGHTLVERLAREGHAWVHLRVATVRTLALERIGPALAREGRRLLSRAQALTLVEQACARVLRPDSYFGALRERPGLHRAMHRTLDELRAADIGASRLPSSAFADPRKATELQEILGGYTRALSEGGFVDGLDVLARAAKLESPPGTSALYLLPADVELSELERALLERLAGDRLRRLAVDEPSAWTARAADAAISRAIGEENELRDVFRRCLSAGIPFDHVELLHTDESVYPALVWELSREHGVPCTFGGGVPVTYSRPGQAALAFFGWMAEGFAADRLRAALASGALTLQGLDAAPDAPGAAAAARELRRARIGWGRRRYAAALDRLIRELEGPERPSRRDDTLEEPPEERSAGRQRRLAAARLARAFTTRALELAPADGSDDRLRALARGAATFVSEFARVTDDLDAAARVALETLFRELADLPAAPVRLEEALERLRDAVTELAVLADRPRPGRLHVSGFAEGGHSGRRHTFLVGLDETRHPGRDLEDPVLLDDERRRINEALDRPRLSLERERPRERTRALQACVARLRGAWTASYSKFDLRNLSMAGEPAPSPFLLDLHRAKTGVDADYGKMLAALPPPAGFVPEADAALDESEWWLARLAAAPPRAGAALVRARFPWLEDGRRALEARASDGFTAWDGRLSAPSPELDPRRSGRPTSASLVQALAGCPFSYFVRNVLRVRPPDDLERDATRWLEPRDEGSLLHEVFRELLETLTDRGEKPDPGRHTALLDGIADGRIEAWRERVPPSSDVAFEAQKETIRQACRTFLAAEAEHCRTVTPRYFEVGFGLPAAGASEGPLNSAEPVEIALGNGDRVRLRGSIDRIDETGNGTFEVWDYKTGSAAGVQEGRGLFGGRQAQPALYAMALEELLRRAGREGRVERSGYFFPGRKGEGQRLTIPVDPAATRRALATLFDLTAAGLFPHATSRDGCKFCDFEAVCGGPDASSEASKRKLAAASEAPLTAFRKLHDDEEA